MLRKARAIPPQEGTRSTIPLPFKKKNKLFCMLCSCSELRLLHECEDLSLLD